MERLFVGDEVTVLPPYDNLPVILAMQRYVRVAKDAAAAEVVVELDASLPPGKRFTVPAAQLQRGWKDGNGRWRMP
jgi:hypothetical protein